uniref:BTB/POZ domain-containing protein n=1 Tax=Ascaris lumbricoides TaxID=6252 RepID=A0A0M3I376_ASCLU
MTSFAVDVADRCCAMTTTQRRVRIDDRGVPLCVRVCMCVYMCDRAATQNFLDTHARLCADSDDVKMVDCLSPDLLLYH